MSQHPIPEDTLEEWKSEVAVGSYTPTLLATAIDRSLQDSLSLPTGEDLLERSREPLLDTIASILDLADDLQAILGEKIDTATAMFSHQPSPPSTRSTLPRHLWLKSDRHDISNIRQRANAIRCLIRLKPRPPTDTQEEPSHFDTPRYLYGVASTRHYRCAY